MEVALYVRVSTSRQQQQQTIEQQLSRLRNYVAARPEWHVADEHIYRSASRSGSPPGSCGHGRRGMCADHGP